MKINLFDKNGNLNSYMSILLGVLGAVLTFAPLYFQLHLYLVVGGALIGASMMVFASIALQSATLNLQAFTNDPLGWRKAKESYKETIGAENDEQDSTASSNRQ